jgi:tetratricopeptide (TPR) repeat protein/mono/diheme cytochrome c family protein
MSLPKPSRKTGPKRRRRLVICVVGILPIILLVLFGRVILSRWAHWMAVRRMNASAISAAQQWLARAVWFDPSGGNLKLTLAACYRRQGQMGRWRKALESARQFGAPDERIQQEMELGRIRSGELGDQSRTRLDALLRAGVPAQDVAEAFVLGCLALGQAEKAVALLDGWEADNPNDAHVAYMRGVYWRQMGDTDRAAAEFEGALARQPGHELARVAIAELFESEDRLDPAFDHFIDVLIRFPESEPGRLGLARVLRKALRLDDARRVLEPLASRAEPSSPVAAEMGEIELASGDYEEAERWFARVDFDQTSGETTAAAAILCALEGKTVRAERLFAQYMAGQTASTRMYDLQVRLTIDPGDTEAFDELRRLSTSGVGGSGNPAEDAGADEREASGASGPELYAFHCSACHGAEGDGVGRAARHLFPRPRDFRSERFRLVSTLNGVPTLADLERVTRLGMPGTSMPAYDELTEDQREFLAHEVLRLHREGVRDQFIHALRQEGEEIDEDEVQEVVGQCTTPDQVVKTPQIGDPDPEALARGKVTYLELGCNKCHGDDGVGAADAIHFDEKGRPARPRDLVRELFKGGSDSPSIYLRLALGMPGTPHPATRDLAEKELVDLVHYCRSLAREPKRRLTSHQQAVLATADDYLSAFGG